MNLSNQKVIIMKKVPIVYLTLLLSVVGMNACGGYSNDAIGRTYEFICSDMINNCQECDSRWFIKIDDNISATIYSSPSTNSILKSCMTQIDYKFNSETGSITIRKMPNSNVNYNCQKSFVGTWSFKRKGKKGIGFYKNSDCGFVR